jgi:hypothetical protein
VLNKADGAIRCRLPAPTSIDPKKQNRGAYTQKKLVPSKSGVYLSQPFRIYLRRPMTHKRFILNKDYNSFRFDVSYYETKILPQVAERSLNVSK